MTEYQKSISTFLKTERGQQMLEELMDIIVAATVERIAAEEAQREAWNRAGFTDEEIDRIGLMARSMRGKVTVTHHRGKARS